VKIEMTHDVTNKAPHERTIRPAGETESPLLARLHKECFAKAWSQKQIMPMLAMPGAFVLVAERAGTAEGFIMVRSGGGEAEILTICVVPSARGHRLGQHLITASLAHLLACAEGEDAKALPPLFLEVAESNQAARALYVRMGFEVVGKRPNYYRHDDGSQETALMMKLQP
jgi:ribosomal-protein-alanine N-acetyltransferase